MDQSEKMKLRQKVLYRIDRNDMVTDETVYREIDHVVLHSQDEAYRSLEELVRLRKELFDAIRGFDVLEKYLRDENVSEIMVIGKDKIFVEKNGVLVRTEDSFYDEEELQRLIEQIVAPTNRMVNASSPIVDSRLADGSRVHIIMPPVSLEGPSITIRKFQKGGMTMKKLQDYGEFPAKLTPVLSAFVRGRYNLLISGATNSGKSSLINALAGYIGADERIITIEDSAELQFYNVDNLVRLETKDANVEGKDEITMADLLKASLRMRPDRIIVGEVRGAEAMTMLQALSTGHCGSMSSIHANSCRDALRRLEVMCLMGMEIPLPAVRGLIGSAVDLLIHLRRDSSGKRLLTEICELESFDGADYLLRTLFCRSTEDSTLTLHSRGTSEGRKQTAFPDEKPGTEECKLPSLGGRLKKVGMLSNVANMEEYGQMEKYLQAMGAFDEED